MHQKKVTHVTLFFPDRMWKLTCGEIITHDTQKYRKNIMAFTGHCDESCAPISFCIWALDNSPVGSHVNPPNHSNQMIQLAISLGKLTPPTVDFVAEDFLPECFQHDRDVLFSAVQQDGTSLAYASDELQGDPELVLTAVQQEGMALEYASETLRKMKVVVLEAVRKDGCALQFAAKELRASAQVGEKEVTSRMQLTWYFIKNMEKCRNWMNMMTHNGLFMVVCGICMVLFGFLVIRFVNLFWASNARLQSLALRYKW